jgi:hypothetical protein
MERHPEMEALKTLCDLVRHDPTPEPLHEKARDIPGVEPEVWAFVDAALRDGRVQAFLPDDLGGLEGDEEVFLAWARCLGKREFSSRDVLVGPGRFRGQGGRVEALPGERAAT